VHRFLGQPARRSDTNRVMSSLGTTTRNSSSTPCRLPGLILVGGGHEAFKFGGRLGGSSYSPATSDGEAWLAHAAPWKGRA
jgi:hypothetical protein